ncbi:MAG: ATP-binding protein [Phaeodactylibacter sp.]|nr:ATP-binding protein [Phaeodactylibacter sp.]
MYFRNILPELENWKASANRKPLILRGARQVGKTTAVNLLSSQYKQYIYLNLEKKEDAELFKGQKPFPTLVEAIFFIKDKSIQEPNTLLFIDEIQAVPAAINLLRYFYEDYPWLHVIAAGSLLETIMKEEVTVPVGRVEYKVLRPVSFDEFLIATGERAALEQYNTVPTRDFANEKLLRLFHRYVLIGGMPEIVQHYAKNRNLTALLPIYESLQVSFMDDVEKYARNNTLVNVIRHVMSVMPFEAGNRIKFQNFGQSNYGSREVGEAMRIMEKAMLLHLVYPCTNVSPPVLGNKRKSPRLHLLDTGLMNYVAGLQKGLLNVQELNSLYQGKITEQIVGQELLAAKFNVLNELHFWVREKKDSTAEVDFIYLFEGNIIPVEVKSGHTGRLRSLHLFMDRAPHQMAVRLYAGNLKKEAVRTLAGKAYTLLSLPYYLAGKIEQYLQWAFSGKAETI